MTFVLKAMRRAMFDHRIRQMRAAFHAASVPFSQELLEIEKEAEEFQRRVDAGSAQWEDYDEETGAGRHYGEEFSERRHEAEEALLLVRNAFVIVIYHLWERGAQRWVSQVSKKPNHSHLVAALTEASIVIDKDGLEELRLLVNCLKHNSKDGRKLYALRRDLFANDFDPDAIHPAIGKPLVNIDWAEKVVLTDDNVEEYLRVVRNSGPK
jgi:hypothetical protein